MAVVSMELPWGTPQPIDEVIGRISHRNETDRNGKDPRGITTDIRSALDGLVSEATASDPVMCLGDRAPYCGLSVAAGFFPDGEPFHGKGFSDGPGLGLYLDNVTRVKTEGSDRTSDPVLQIGEIEHADRGLVSLLGNFPDPLNFMERSIGSVEVGKDAIEDRASRLSGPLRFAALMALKSADVVVDCELEAEDQTKAREALYWAIARFAAFHSDDHAAKHSGYPLVIAAHVLRPDEDTLRSKPKEMVAKHLDHKYHKGLQRTLVDTAIDWLVDQTQGPTDLAPREIKQTYPHGK